MKDLKFNDIQTELKEWITNLPLANPLRVAELIYAKLAQMPVTEISSAEYAQLLDLLRPPINFLNELVQNQLSNKSLISFIEPSQEIIANLSLLSRYASAYAILIARMQTDKQHPNDQSLMAVCIHHAIRNLSRILLISYQLYRIPPENLWLRLYKLYLQAERAGIATLPISHDTYDLQTIADAFKQCILLATANPYQLRPVDMLKLYEALWQWSQHTKIISTNFETVLIVFKLDEDTAPFYKKTNTDSNDSPFLRGLETKLLIERIVSAIKQHGHSLSDQRAPFSPLILQGIAQAWSELYTRTLPRASEEGDIQISIGLTATHAHISEKKPLLSTQAGTLLQGEREIELLPDTHLSESKSMIGDPWETSFSQEHVLTSLATSHPLFTWQVINGSALGYCLEANIKQMIALETGELIGLCNKDEKNAAWRLGSVRWVKRFDETHFRFGIMFLGFNPITTMVQVVHSKLNHQYRAFILSDQKEPELKPSTSAFLLASDNHRYSIIIPALDLIAEEHLALFFRDQAIGIKLTEPLCLNNKFYQFKYDIVDLDPNDILEKVGSEGK
ncbi:MAG: hypothetical protein K2Q14_08620 [Gammaproteobacteria bacterium]|nr:hypothetical protein [Gammaproteobacteria bacterium]